MDQVQPKKKIKSEWPKAIQKLISNGHSLSDIGDYTIEQAQSFLKVIMKKEREDVAWSAYANAMAMSKELNKFLKKELEDGQ